MDQGLILQFGSFWVAFISLEDLRLGWGQQLLRRDGVGHAGGMSLEKGKVVNLPMSAQ